MRLLIAAIIAALWMMVPASAAQHSDDRYFDSRAQAAPQKALARKQIRRHVKGYRQYAQRARNSVTKSVLAPRLKYRRIAWQQLQLPDSIAVGEMPRNKRGQLLPWCGWWLGQMLGLHDRSLWIARNWATVGTRLEEPVPGAIAVWKHHVGKITEVRADGTIKVLSGNDGHAVRDRWRSARGVIAYRAL